MQPDTTAHRQTVADSATPFPVVHSVLSARALMAEVLPHYDLGPVVQCSLFAHNQNDLYLVRTSGDRYMLRITQAHGTITPRSRQDVLYELDVLVHLSVLCGLGAPVVGWAQEVRP